MRILIGIPTYDRRLDIELARTLINMERLGKHTFDYIFPVSSHLSRNRNMACLQALADGHDYLLFLDSDVGISDISFVESLMETAYRLGAQIVGGAYRMKKLDEVVYIAGNYKNGKLENIRESPKTPQLVESVGTGIMLIHISVLRKLSDPWFTIVDKPTLEVEPEDFYFCRKAREAGFKVALDPRFETHHFGQYSWTHFV